MFILIMTIIIRAHHGNLDQVPLCQVNLLYGEEQWRLLHRMTGPRDQVIISPLSLMIPMKMKITILIIDETNEEL